MGYSISEQTYRREQALRAEDRLCQYGRCTTRAQWEALTITHDEHGEETSLSRYCTKHARQCCTNGVNFTTVGVRRLARHEEPRRRPAGELSTYALGRFMTEAEADAWRSRPDVELV